MHPQHGEKGRGVQQEDGPRPGGGDHEAAQRRPDGAGHIEPHDIERNRGGQLLAFDDIGDHRLPGRTVERRPHAHEEVSTSRVQADIRPARVSPPRARATRSSQAWVTSNSFRRSTTSASAPAGRPTRNIGRLVAVCSSATSSGESRE